MNTTTKANQLTKAAGFPVSVETVNGKMIAWPTTRKVTAKPEQQKRLARLAQIAGSVVSFESYVRI